MTKKEMASMIDHTILKAAATKAEVKQLCAEARDNGFASICVNPCYVPLVAEELKGSDSRVCCVIGFPLGANAPEVKGFETKQAVAQGAQEVDMVINVGALKDRDLNLVEKDIRAVVDNSGDALVKVIIETCYLTDEEKKIVCEISEKAGADYVKTSTGFGTGGATAEDVALMRKTVSDRVSVKASGGIRTLADAEAMVAAGANRLGCSAGIAIMGEMDGKKNESNTSGY